jgi:hypothetical protein
MLKINFCCGSSRKLGRSCNMGGGGGLEVYMNLMPPRIPKVNFFPIFWTFWAASNGRHKSLPNSFYVTCNEKKTHTMTFFKEIA